MNRDRVEIQPLMAQSQGGLIYGFVDTRFPRRANLHCIRLAAVPISLFQSLSMLSGRADVIRFFC